MIGDLYFGRRFEGRLRVCGVLSGWCLFMFKFKDLLEGLGLVWAGSLAGGLDFYFFIYFFHCFRFCFSSSKDMMWSSTFSNSTMVFALLYRSRHARVLCYL
jgi:hypothetical protein